MIAIPDFAAGAMENWGLITYRETAMLYEKGVSSEGNKQRVAIVVSHELAHQVDYLVFNAIFNIILVTLWKPVHLWIHAFLEFFFNPLTDDKILDWSKLKQIANSGNLFYLLIDQQCNLNCLVCCLQIDG